MWTERTEQSEISEYSRKCQIKLCLVIRKVNTEQFCEAG